MSYLWKVTESNKKKQFKIFTFCVKWENWAPSVIGGKLKHGDFQNKIVGKAVHRKLRKASETKFFFRISQVQNLSKILSKAKLTLTAKEKN